MPNMGRAKRSTLTHAQIYGGAMDPAGFQEGKGIFDSIGNFLKKSMISYQLNGIRWDR